MEDSTAPEMPDEGEVAYEEPVGASAYLNEIRKEALGVLYPSPAEQKERMPPISILRGKAPDLYDLYRGAIVWEVLQAIREHRTINWADLEPTHFLKSHTPSIQGTGRKQAVEIGRAVVPSERRRSMFDVLRNR